MLPFVKRMVVIQSLMHKNLIPMVFNGTAPAGDGTFVNDTSLTPTYTPGQNDYANWFC
jgi:hypothetical protein